MKKKVEEKTHARFAPSSSKIWMNCHGMVALSMTCPPQVASEAAKEGTLAHEFAERLLRLELRSFGTKTEKERLRKIILDEIEDDEMCGHVEDYVDFVVKVREKFLAKYPDRFIEFVEEKFHYNEHNSGTVDYGVIAGNACVLIDLKYGAGVEVEAKDNPQLKNYALCIAEKYPEIGQFHIFIYQPRIGDVAHDRFDTEIVTINKFKKEVDKSIREGLRLIKTGVDIENLKEGDWCQFCPAIAVCPKKLKVVEETALTHFQDESFVPVENIPLERLVTIYRSKSDIEKFLKKLEAYLHGKLLAGDSIDGVKLVTGKGKRSWRKDLSVSELKKLLKAKGVKNPTVEKIVGLGEAEKALRGTGEVIDDCVKEPSTYPVLALDTDKRPGWDNTALVETLFDIEED
jgi:hypothetical protein